MKRVIDSARWTVFTLSIIGAMAAAIASQMEASADGAVNARTWVATLGVVCLAAGTFFTSRLLGTDHVTSWVRARAIAEALKREAYKFAASAAPYDDADKSKAAALLDETRQKTERDGDDLLIHLVTATDTGSLPRAPVTEDEYITHRVTNQIDFYNSRADGYQSTATTLRGVEFALVLGATLITAVATVTGKLAPVGGMRFDLAAVTGVLTTVAGGVLAHIEASRFDFLAMTYRVTARRLDDRLGEPHVPWSAFVNDCEGILAAENTSWIAKWTK